MKSTIKSNLQNFCFVLPAFVIFCIFYVYPFLNMFFLSFHEWRGIGPMHFIGLQNYTRWVVRDLKIVPIVHALNIPPKKLGHDLTEMGWEIYPEGMYQIIKQFAKYPGVKKIYLTENGVAVKDVMVNGEINDVRRTQYIKDYLAQILKAKREGVNIGGYFIWSFMDNFEWAEGYRPKLGIVAVDYKTQQRTIKASGKWFSEFLKGS